MISDPSRAARRLAPVARLMLSIALIVTVTVTPFSRYALAAPAFPVDFRAFAFSPGTFAGTQLAQGGGALTLAGAGLTTGTYVDPYGYGARDYVSGSWTSPWVDPGFGFVDLIASWNADTPPGTWIEVAMQGTPSTASPTAPWSPPSP